MNNTTTTTSSSANNVENDEIQLELPLDSVDSTTDSTIIQPIIEDVVLPNVNNLIYILYYFILIC